MQQHAQPIDRRRADPARFGEQGRLQRRINNVANQRRFGQRREREIKRRLSDHALTGGVDDKTGVGERVIALRLRQRDDLRDDLRAEQFRQRRRALGRTIEQTNIARAGVDQSGENGA